MGDNIKNRLVDQYLTALASGDQKAMEDLYDLVSRPLYALCYSYFRNKHDSEDALQESFLTIKREIGRFNGTNGFNWIYTITKNCCLKGVRKAERVKPVDFTDSVAVNKYLGSESGGEPVAFDESGIIKLSRDILSDNEFEILIYRAVYNMSFKEISKFTGHVEATVRWQYHNAISKVRKEYERRCGDK